MGHLSAYRRMLIWGIGTLMAIVGVARFLLSRQMNFNDLIINVSLSIGGWVVIIINEIVFSVRKEQLEIDRDETIKGSGEKHPHSPMILAICPQCKSRIPSNSKYCPECGTDLQRLTP